MIILIHLSILVSFLGICYLLYVVVGLLGDRSMRGLVGRCCFRVGLISFALLFSIFRVFIRIFGIFIFRFSSLTAVGRNLLVEDLVLFLNSSSVSIMLILADH